MHPKLKMVRPKLKMVILFSPVTLKVRNGFCWSSALPCWSKSASFIVSEEYHKGRKGLAEEPPVHRREALVHVHDFRHLELPYKSVAELLRDLSGHTPPSRYLYLCWWPLSLSLQVCKSAPALLGRAHARC